MENYLDELKKIVAGRDESGRPIYLQLQDSMSQMISDGRIPDGTRLPPDTVLAGMLGISHITWAKVLNALRQRGIAERSRQRGTFIRRPRRTAAMAEGKSNVIAIFMDTITPQNMNSDFMETLQEELSRHGFRPAFISAAESSQIQYSQVVNAMNMPECCGGLIWSLMDGSQVQSLLEIRPVAWPLVFMAADHALDGEKKHSFLHYDGFNAGLEIAERFIASGGKYVSVLLCERHLYQSGLQRLQGIEEAFARAELPAKNVEVIRWENEEETLEKVLNRRPDSLLVAVAPMEIKLLKKALLSKNMPLSALGKAIGITPSGFSEDHLWNLPLYLFDTRELCRQAVDVLLKHLNEPDTPCRYQLLKGKFQNHEVSYL
jgi:DNA-binding LacI/PurR family transcriptional regulator